jgi:hypothetical protein
VPSETAENAPTPRDRHLQAIAEHGRMGWQKASGYNWRALVEADIGRWKRVIGHALRSQTNERQAAEVAIAVDVPVDGLYTADPKTNPDAEFIPEINTAELIAQNLPTLPIEPVVLELLSRGRLARSIQIINGLVPGNLTRALNGEPIGTVIHGARRPA